MTFSRPAHDRLTAADFGIDFDGRPRAAKAPHPLARAIALSLGFHHAITFGSAGSEVDVQPFQIDHLDIGSRRGRSNELG